MRNLDLKAATASAGCTCEPATLRCYDEGDIHLHMSNASYTVAKAARTDRPRYVSLRLLSGTLCDVLAACMTKGSQPSFSLPANMLQLEIWEA
jgi:hypothetical protein